MQNKFYTVNVFNNYSSNTISEALCSCISDKTDYVIVCIGSDIILGDSLGPLVGTMLKQKKIDAFIYGTLKSPITAKEVETIKKQIKNFHPNAKIIAIDAAVGNIDDVGLIKIYNKGLYPGKGVNKDMGIIGDVSIMGIVQTKSNKNYNLYNLTRLGLVYKMAEQISDGVSDFINQNHLKQFAV